MSPKKRPRESVSEAIEIDQKSGGFSSEERVAMRERVQELKTESLHGTRSRKDGERDVLAKIAEMPGPDRQIALRLHDIVKANAPALSPRTWYGMPAYARDDRVVCFFQGAKKFDSRYAALGFTDAADLDEGDMWPTSFAVKRLTPAVEESIAMQIKRAVSRSPGLRAATPATA